MQESKKLPVRIAFYIFGFLIMTLGIAISVKSNLGVSPVSSIPYTITCVWGIEMGRATIFFHIGLVIIQILLLRRNFKLKNLLQVPAGVLFGVFTTFCNSLMAFFPDPSSIWIQLVMMFFSAFFLAFGIFLYVPVDFIPLAGEGTVLAISEVTRIKFSTVKTFFDISMVTISLTTCLFCIHKLGSVGLGTIISAFLVGSILKVITRFLGETRDRLLRADRDAEFSDVEGTSVLAQIMKTDVYAISEDMTLRDVLRFLTEKKISGCPVLDKNGELMGFIDYGDILKYLSSDQSLFISSSDLQKEDFNKKAAELMAKKVSFLAEKHIISVDINDSMDDVCAVFSEYHLKKVPVMKNGKMAGIVNASNITKYILSCAEKA